MSVLTQLQRAFVRAYVRRGMKHASLAYRDAGYENSENGSRVNAHFLTHDPRIQSAIQEECLREFMTLAPMAMRVIGELADNPQVESSTRLKAASTILDRTGIHKVVEQKVTVEHIGDDPAKVARARMLMKRLGIDDDKAEALFGRVLGEKVVDVEYEDVAPIEELNW